MLLLAQPGAFAQGPPPANVVVDPVRLEPVELWRQVTGELRSLRRSNLAAQEPGLVIEMLVDAGDEVRQGEVIARLDPALAQIAADAADADIAASRSDIQRFDAELAQARRDLERFKTMSLENASNEIELERAQTTVDRVLAQRARASAELLSASVRKRDADERVKDLTIRAPFAGRVTRKHTEQGQWLSRDDSVIELLSLDQMEAILDIPEGLIANLEEGKTRVRIVVGAIRDPDPRDPAQTISFERVVPVTRIIPDADPATRQFAVRVAIHDPRRRARPGMTVVGFVPAGNVAQELTIHKDAILRDDAGEFVFIDASGRAMPARIRTKFALDDRVVIVPGSLRAGMSVVIEGNERLFPTQPLHVVEHAPAQPSSQPADQPAVGLPD